MALLSTLKLISGFPNECVILCKDDTLENIIIHIFRISFRAFEKIASDLRLGEYSGFFYHFFFIIFIPIK